MFNLARAIKSLVGCFTSSFVVVGTHVGSQSFAESKLSKTAFLSFCVGLCVLREVGKEGALYIFTASSLSFIGD